MAKFVTFGEIMLRLSPVGYNRFIQASSFDAVYGGSEANVAVGLANLGEESEYITKLPDNPIGKAALGELRKHGVDTSRSVLGGERIGIYYLEKGADARPSNVVYDRKYSSFYASEKDDFDFDKAFADADVFHISGITPAVSDKTRQSAEYSVRSAKTHGCLVSLDLNYRSKLWSTHDAGNTLSKLLADTDILIANEEHCKLLFGVDKDNIADDRERYTAVAREMSEKFGIGRVVLTIRRTISANENEFSAMIYSGGDTAYSRVYPMQMIDRVGGGDAFAAGLLYAVMHKNDIQDIIEFAVAAGVLKHSVNGDFPIYTVCEIENLAKNGRNGRLSR